MATAQQTAGLARSPAAAGTRAELRWLARRAATELAIDPDLRFVRFQDTIVPDPGAGQPLGAMGLSTAVSELKRLLDLDPGPQTDPLTDKLKTVGARGRIGAAVTRLEIQPDMSNVTVESTLWVREGQQWLLFGSRNATVRPDDLGQEAGKELAEDPQIKGAFQIAELLGLGAVPADVKQRSLRIGAATQRHSGWLAPPSIKTSMTSHCPFWNPWATRGNPRTKTGPPQRSGRVVGLSKRGRSR